MRVRPVRMDDAPFIVWLRNLDYVKGKVGDSAGDVASQEAWLRAYFKRAGDYYFIVETPGGIPVGTHSVYGVSGAKAEVGRWIIRPGVQAAILSQVVVVDMAFGRLGLKSLRSVAVASNRPVLSLTRNIGFKQVRVEVAGRLIGGKTVDLVHFALAIEEWPQARERLLPMAKLAERLVCEWEQAQLRDKSGAPPDPNQRDMNRN